MIVAALAVPGEIPFLPEVGTLPLSSATLGSMGLLVPAPGMWAASGAETASAATGAAERLTARARAG